MSKEFCYSDPAAMVGDISKQSWIKSKDAEQQLLNRSFESSSTAVKNWSAGSFDQVLNLVALVRESEITVM
ncbi:hypothetical protein T10_2756 [Trichinella papuae]|uniref:Uncharacterized protein n=1 Tax=Trichinella papuae TaxID=268474 RepID=A0A0V1M721_9BILA|nr:hypothetical protein T10_2756 [Trichinella papuae]